MASAFSNNTERLNSSDRTSNFKAKTNYNYLRLVSLKNVDNQSNYVGCKNKRFSSSSGNVILGYNPNPQDTPPKRSSDPSEATLSKLVSTRSYDLRSSINKGFYLPTTIPKNDTTNNNINRPPYTYDPDCNEFFEQEDEIYYTQPNTSGDLQDILFNEYLDFGNLTLITNTQFVNNSLNNDLDNINDTRPFKTMNPNQVQVTDASFGDYIIDPNNILKNYKDSELSTYLNLQKAETSYTDNGKKKILKVINWKKLQINSFPNNKYHRFSVNEPIKFYNYAACSDMKSPPSDIPFGQDIISTKIKWNQDDIISQTPPKLAN